MGWDAHSSAETKEVNGKNRIKDPYARKLFRDATKKLEAKGCGVDGYFKHGGLDCSEVGDMLERVTGLSTTGAEWSKATVQLAWKSSKWDFKYTKEESFAYWNAKLFLEVCAEAGLSISFSW